MGSEEKVDSEEPIFFLKRDFNLLPLIPTEPNPIKLPVDKDVIGFDASKEQGGGG